MTLPFLGLDARKARSSYHGFVVKERAYSPCSFPFAWLFDPDQKNSSIRKEFGVIIQQITAECQLKTAFEEQMRLDEDHASHFKLLPRSVKATLGEKSGFRKWIGLGTRHPL